MGAQVAGDGCGGTEEGAGGPLRWSPACVGMHHTSLLVPQLCQGPPGRGCFLGEGASGQPPAAGTGGGAGSLQHLGEHPLSAGLPGGHQRHCESRGTVPRVPCHGMCGVAPVPTVPADTPTALVALGASLRLVVGTSTLPVGPTCARSLKHLAAGPGPWSLRLMSFHLLVVVVTVWEGASEDQVIRAWLECFSPIGRYQELTPGVSSLGMGHMGHASI